MATYVSTWCHSKIENCLTDVSENTIIHQHSHNTSAFLKLKIFLNVWHHLSIRQQIVIDVDRLWMLLPTERNTIKICQNQFKNSLFGHNDGIWRLYDICHLTVLWKSSVNPFEMTVTSSFLWKNSLLVIFLLLWWILPKSTKTFWTTRIHF